MVYKQIGEKIREFRKLKHLTQEELGEKVGVSYQQIQKYEKGLTKMYVSRLYDIAMALEVSVTALLSDSDWLLTGERKPNFSMTYVTKEEREWVQLYRDLADEKAISALAAIMKLLSR